MNTKNPLISGTLILTGAGLITRAIGFLNRIYLSQLIGAEEMGIYQLIFPVYMVAFSLCCHGIELALSQMTAQYFARGKNETIRPLIFTASLFSIFLAGLLSFAIWHASDLISIYLLHEKSCSLCLKMMAPILPFTALRCCLHGYYIGLKKTGVPAAGQLMEQLTRVGVIYLISSYYIGNRFNASLAVAGMAAGEICGTLFTFVSYRIQIKKRSTSKSSSSVSHRMLVKELLSRSIPLTGNKLALTLFSSVESILIPLMLTGYYDDKSLALSMYGVLTGMALPFIMFPSTLTNSLSVMLLPAVSEANAKNNKKQILHTIEKAVKLCLTLGFAALFFFFFFGKQLGIYVFHNESAGDFLLILSFLCPFLYLSSTGASILNGLGQMRSTFLYSMAGLFIRVASILFLVPTMGVQGYLLGLLAAYLVVVGMQVRKISVLLK